jgi:hypothetical protein
VVDPFLGTGTTLRAAAAAGRNSIGYEIEPGLRSEILSDLPGLVGFANDRVQARIDDHLSFVDQCRETGREMKHVNKNYRFPVVTRQESELLIDVLEEIAPLEPDGFRVTYSKEPCRVLDPNGCFAASHPPKTSGQLSLF